MVAGRINVIAEQRFYLINCFCFDNQPDNDGMVARVLGHGFFIRIGDRFRWDAICACVAISYLLRNYSPPLVLPALLLVRHLRRQESSENNVPKGHVIRCRKRPV